MRAIWMAALVTLACLAHAGGGSIPGRTFATPPKVDGVITKEEWADASAFEGLVDQDTGYPTQEGGTFWLAYDQKFIYFAARLQDREPNKIQATEYRTNVGLKGNDTVTLQVDPFGRLSDFNSFSINPRGATNIQIAGGRAAKREWLGDIAAAGRITPDGWECEARIPWSIMRLPPPGQRDICFNIYRDFRRMQRTYCWGFTNGGRTQNFGRWLAVRVPPAPPGSIKLLPYVYAGYDQDEGEVLNAGLDYRTSLTDDIDLVGAINPDFRNIENQVLSLDFSYFERLANESRPFFLEGGQYFRTSWEAPIFASQRIAGFDTGVKVFGKIDDRTDVGLMDAVDFDNENSLVARVHRQLASRTGIDAAYVDYGIPGLSNASTFVNFQQGFGPYSVYGQHEGTRDTEAGQGDRLNAGASYYKDGMGWNANWVRVSPDFLPRLGFAPEVDYSGFYGGLSQTRLTSRYGLMEHQYGLNVNQFKHIDGSPYRERLGVSTSLTWKDGTDLDMYYNAENFYPYRDRVFSFGLERPRGDVYRRWSIDGAFGEVSGAPYANRSLSFSYRPSRMLQLTGSQQWVTYQHEDHSQTIVSANMDLGRDMSVSGRAIHRDGDTNGYLAFRRSGNRGAEYFVILGDPNAETFRFSLVLKVTVPFELRR